MNRVQILCLPCCPADMQYRRCVVSVQPGGPSCTPDDKASTAEDNSGVVLTTKLWYQVSLSILIGHVICGVLSSRFRWVHDWRNKLYQRLMDHH